MREGSILDFRDLGDYPCCEFCLESGCVCNQIDSNDGCKVCGCRGCSARKVNIGDTKKMKRRVYRDLASTFDYPPGTEESRSYIVHCCYRCSVKCVCIIPPKDRDLIGASERRFYSQGCVNCKCDGCSRDDQDYQRAKRPVVFCPDCNEILFSDMCKCK